MTRDRLADLRAVSYITTNQFVIIRMSYIKRMILSIYAIKEHDRR